MDKTENRLKEVVKNLFTGEKVDLVIGYEDGSLPLRSRPCFIQSAEEVDRLVWNFYCTGNLAIYLPRFFQIQEHKRNDEKPLPKIGIVAKGCDARSVLGLVKENQIPRENIVIIGMPCSGMVYKGRLDRALDGSVISEYKELPDGNLEVVTHLGEKRKLNREDVIAEACIECFQPSPENADIKIEGESREASNERYKKVREFEDKSLEERWKNFVQEISSCIRCNACRQACPNCYCKVCFADQTKPRWLGAGTDISDVIFYHIVRLFHQAGRCIECDSCVAACPMGINLRLFGQKLGKDVKELFDYVPGMKAEEPLPLCTFKQDDSQSFITEP